ncbi:MAG TPA: hypothetical protein VHA82_15055 [Ramlibacter sp.]|uniref:hypothetical protein n=1 Tax=Ramlibacter sp. TaxID=1917967 RepID=UPI002BD60654|nr:hypothetical protein [Ramlibacter sp.]HVZ45127.1 hypothetical protein [Ramlibacter sp.]
MTTRDRTRSRKSAISFCAIALLAFGAAAAQVATPGTAGIDASGSYQHEVQSCMSGRTQQDQATCLREARNAAADKKHGVLDTQGDLTANALARCDVFQSADDKAACHARVTGQGQIEGSVAEGGLIRETEQTVELGAGPAPTR